MAGLKNARHGMADAQGPDMRRKWKKNRKSKKRNGARRKKEKKRKRRNKKDKKRPPWNGGRLRTGK